MKVRSIRVELELDDGKFTRRVVTAKGAVRDLGRETEKAASRVKRSETAFRGFGGVLRDATIIAGLARSALANLNLVFTGVFSSVMKASGEIERMTVMLEGMSNAATKTERLAEAKDNVDRLIQTAMKAPFSIGALSDSFVKMKSVGIDPWAGGLKSMTDAVAAFGGTDQTFHRAAIAIQQMAGKGVISMEELRQQLGEAVPRSIELMARSLNMTYRDLVDKISKGQIEAKSALANMFSEFEKVFGGRAENLMNTWVGMMQRVSTQWTLFRNDVGNSGVFAEMKNQVKDLLYAFNDDEVMRLSKVIGSMMADIVRQVRKAVDWFVEFRSEILTAVKALGGFLIVSRISRAMIALGAAIATTVTKMRIMWASTVTGSAAIDALIVKLWAGGVAARGFGTALFAVGGVLKGLRFAFGALLGPIGLVATAVWSLGEAFGFFGSEGKRALEQIKNSTSAILDQKELDSAAQAITDKYEKLLALQERVARSSKDISRADKVDLPVLKDRHAKLVKAEEELRSELLDVQNRYDIVSKRMSRRRLDDETEALIAGYRERIEAIRSSYDQEAALFAKRRVDAGKDKNEIVKINKEALAARHAYHDSMIKTIESGLEKERASLTDGSAKNIEVTKNAIAVLTKLLGEASNAKLQDPFGKSEILAPAGPNGAKLDKYEQAYKRYTVRIAELNEKLNGTRSEAEKVREELTVDPGEVLKGLTDEQKLAKIIELAGEFQALKEKVTAFSKAEARMTSATGEITDAYEKTRKKAETLRAALLNPENVVANSSGFINLYQRLEEQINKIDRTKFADDYTAAWARMTLALKQFKQNEMREEALSLVEKTRTLQSGLLRKRQAVEAEYRAEVKRVKRTIDLSLFEGDERKRMEAQVQAYIKALRDKADRDTEYQFQRLAREWGDVIDQLDQASGKWLESFVDGMVDGIAEGKMEWRSFVEMILKDLLRIQMKKAMSGILDSVSGEDGVLKDVFDGIAGTVKKIVTGENHLGGIIGREVSNFRAVSAAAFAGARRLHDGGIAGGLRSNEVPTILEKGEGVFTAAQMKALGGGRDMQINVINQSGQQLKGTTGAPRFDGEKTVLDLVLRAANTPGSFRDSLRNAVR